MLSFELSNVSRIMRVQAWNKAKAEIENVLCTFYGLSNAAEGQFDKLSALSEKYIADVENDSLQE